MVGKGEMVELMCNYQVEGEAELYSLKWYRDNVEFYRYIPSGKITTNTIIIIVIIVTHIIIIICIIVTNIIIIILIIVTNIIIINVKTTTQLNLNLTKCYLG